VTVAAFGVLASAWLGGCTGWNRTDRSTTDQPATDRPATDPGQSGTAGHQVVTVSAGPRRSVYLGWSTALAEHVRRDHPGLILDVRISTGSIENLHRLGDAEAMLTVAATDAAAVALRGESPFTAQVPATAMARVYDDYVHLVVRDDSSLVTLKDLAGRRVAVGPPGSGTALVSQRLLQDQSLRVDALHLDVVEAGLDLQARRLDAVFWLGGLPTRAVTELAQRVRIRMLPLGEAAARLRARHAAAYRPATIPANTYGRPEGVPTVASANLLLCRSDAPADLVRIVLETAFRRREAIAAAQPAGDALDLRAAIATDPVPLHPAAATFYRAAKP
jgi:TRAP transporter TAXI family solute receptor